MKPRRRTDGAPMEEGDMPGTAILNLQASQQHALDASPGARPLLSQTPSSNSSLPTLPSQPPVVPAASVATSTSALTPPDETIAPGSSRKRRQQAPATSLAPTLTAPPAISGADTIVSPPMTGSALVQTTSSPQKRRRTSQNPTTFSSVSSSSANPSSLQGVPNQPSQAPPSEPTTVAGLVQLPLLEEVLETIKTRATPPRWREQALDIFFQEFSGEELDLQVKISENVLSNNENKAMVFCKMPPMVRRHWVGKFREMHQLNKTS